MADGDLIPSVPVSSVPVSSMSVTSIHAPSMTTPADLTDAIDFSRVRRVLVVKLRYHGDVLLSSPVLSTLKRQHPHLEIDALVYRETAEMLSQHPDLTQLHLVDKGWKQAGTIAHLRAELGLLQDLRERRYDLLIHLTEHWRGAVIKRLLGIPLAVTANYVRRAGSRWWRGSFTHHYPVPKHPRHKVESHLDALRRLGVFPRVAEQALQLVPGIAAAASADAKLAQIGLGGQPFILIHPTSRFFYKCWTPTGMAALIDALQQQLPVLLTAAPTAAEQGMIDAILALTTTRPASLAGQLSLKELAHCIGRARLFVGVDSAPMHMAAAMQTPTVALFGPSTPGVWGPWQVEHRIVASRPTCQPCQQRGCGDSQVSDCLLTLPVGAVLQACRDLLHTDTSSKEIN